MKNDKVRGSKVRRTPLHRLVRLQLDLDVTSTMVSRALLVVTSPLVLIQTGKL
jgi:hypothetical protein